MNQKLLNFFLKDLLESNSMALVRKLTLTIMDARYEVADLPKLVAENYSHLTTLQQVKLLVLLKIFKVIFDGTLGDWQTDLISLKPTPSAKQYHGMPLIILHVHLNTLKKRCSQWNR